MNISIAIRLIIILIVLAVILFIISKFINKNNPKKTSDIIDEDLAQTPVIEQITNNIDKSGIYFKGIDPKNKDDDDLKIVYIVKDNIYYVGKCSQCPKVCNAATIVRDLYKGNCVTDNTTGYLTCSPTLVSSADNLMNDYLQRAGNKTFTNADCSITINNSNSALANMNNKDFQKSMSEKLDGSFINIWDFIEKNKIAFIQLSATVGAQIALSRIFRDYAAAIIMLPGFINANSYDQLVNGLSISFTVAQPIFEGIGKTLASFSTNKIFEKIAQESGESIVKYATKTSTMLLIKNSVRTAAKQLMKFLVSMLEMMNPVFIIADILGLFGMALDLLDPCGFNSTIDDETLKNTGRAMDIAFLNQISSFAATSPVVWGAENIPIYNLNCSLSKSIDNNMKQFLVRQGSNTPILDDGGENTSCETNEQQLLSQYIEEYYSNLNVNSLGECVKYNITKQEIDQRVSQILGVKVTVPTPTEALNNGFDTEGIQNIFDYASIILANNNTLIAAYIKTYKYIIIFSLIAIVIIAFFI